MSTRYPKTTSNRLFWETLREGSDTPAKSVALPFAAAEEDVDSRVLRVLKESGGMATRSQVEVQTGVPRRRSRWAVNRLAKKGLVIQETGKGDIVMLRLKPRAWTLSPAAETAVRPDTH